MNKIFMIYIFIILIMSSVYATESESNANLEIEIPTDYQTISSGEEIIFAIKFFHFAQESRRDVTLNYDIIDIQGNVVTTKSETVAVETQASFIAKVSIPLNLKEGNYNLRVSILPDDLSSAQAISSFTIKNRSNIPYFIILIGLVVLIVIVFILVKGKLLLKKFRMKRKIKKIVREKSKKTYFQNV